MSDEQYENGEPTRPAEDAAPTPADAAADEARSPEDATARLEQRVAELEDRYHRAVADLSNAHKRFQKERERLSRSAVAGFVKKLLPMVDSMSHSLKAAQESHDAAALITGFRLVESQMLQTFGENDIQPIASVGEPFDPEFHHAVSMEFTDEIPAGTVVEELGQGFVMGEVLIRPSQVKVAAPPPTAAGPDDAE